MEAKTFRRQLLSIILLTVPSEVNGGFRYKPFETEPLPTPLVGIA